MQGWICWAMGKNICLFGAFFFRVPVCNLIKSLMLQERTYGSSIGCSDLRFLVKKSQSTGSKQMNDRLQDGRSA